jgi:hypothetical protein
MIWFHSKHLDRMTSNLECLVLGASLSAVYQKFVVEKPDVKSALADIGEIFQRYGHDPRWSMPPVIAIASHNGGPNHNHRWILNKATPKCPSDEERRAAAELNKIIYSINELAAPHVISLVDRFRRREWIADGIKEPPSHDLDRTIIQPEWWQRNDSIINFADGNLSRRVLNEAVINSKSTALRHLMRWQNVKQFSMILAIEAFPERRVSPGSDLLRAVDALADPSDIERLHEARAGNDKAFEDLDQHLRKELFSLLLRDRLRLSRHDQAQSDLNWVRKDTLEDAVLNFEESTLTSAGIKNAPVLVHPVEQQAPVSINLTQEIKRQEMKKPRKLGRPSRGKEVASTFDRLLVEDVIDLCDPISRIIKQVHQAVIDASDSDDDWGLGDETLRKHITPLVQAEKAKRSQKQ